MPNYDILHKPTGEITEKFFTIAAKEQFLKENPDYEQVFTKMRVGDPVALGVQRPPSDFTNHVLAPIERHYNGGKQRDTRFGRKAKQV
jgi:hypothetical protein